MFPSSNIFEEHPDWDVGESLGKMTDSEDLSIRDAPIRTLSQDSQNVLTLEPLALNLVGDDSQDLTFGEIADSHELFPDSREKVITISSFCIALKKLLKGPAKLGKFCIHIFCRK